MECSNFTGTGSGSISHGEKPSQQEKNPAFQTGSFFGALQTLTSDAPVGTTIRPDASIAVDP